MLWVWLSLLVALVAVAGSVAFAVVRGLEAWRGFRTFAGVSEAAAALSARLEAVGPKAEALGERSVGLSEALERLERSRGRLAVLTSAIADVRAAVNWVTAFVPRK